jgi:hypothetical protein
VAKDIKQERIKIVTQQIKIAERKGETAKAAALRERLAKVSR